MRRNKAQEQEAKRVEEVEKNNKFLKRQNERLLRALRERRHHYATESGHLRENIEKLSADLLKACQRVEEHETRQGRLTQLQRVNTSQTKELTACRTRITNYEQREHEVELREERVSEEERRLREDSNKLEIKRDDFKQAKSRVNDEIRAHNERMEAARKKNQQEIKKVHEQYALYISPAVHDQINAKVAELERKIADHEHALETAQIEQQKQSKEIANLADYNSLLSIGEIPFSNPFDTKQCRLERRLGEANGTVEALKASLKEIECISRAKDDAIEENNRQIKHLKRSLAISQHSQGSQAENITRLRQNFDKQQEKVRTLEKLDRQNHSERYHLKEERDGLKRQNQRLQETIDDFDCQHNIDLQRSYKVLKRSASGKTNRQLRKINDLLEEQGGRLKKAQGEQSGGAQKGPSLQEEEIQVREAAAFERGKSSVVHSCTSIPSSHQEQVKVLKGQIVTLKKQLAAAQSNGTNIANHHQEQIKALNRDASSLKDQLAVERSSKQDLADTKQRLDTELGQARTQYQILNTEYSSLQNRHRQAESEWNQARQHAEHVWQQAQNEWDQARDNADQIYKAEMGRRDSMIENLKKEKRALTPQGTDSLREANDNIRYLNQSLDELEAELQKEQERNVRRNCNGNLTESAHADHSDDDGTTDVKGKGRAKDIGSQSSRYYAKENEATNENHGDDGMTDVEATEKATDTGSPSSSGLANDQKSPSAEPATDEEYGQILGSYLPGNITTADQSANTYEMNDFDPPKERADDQFVTVQAMTPDEISNRLKEYPASQQAGISSSAEEDEIDRQLRGEEDTDEQQPESDCAYPTPQATNTNTAEVHSPAGPSIAQGSLQDPQVSNDNDPSVRTNDPQYPQNNGAQIKLSGEDLETLADIQDGFDEIQASVIPPAPQSSTAAGPPSGTAQNSVLTENGEDSGFYGHSMLDFGNLDDPDAPAEPPADSSGPPPTTTNRNPEVPEATNLPVNQNDTNLPNPAFGVGDNQFSFRFCTNNTAPQSSTTAGPSSGTAQYPDLDENKEDNGNFAARITADRKILTPRLRRRQ